MHATHRLSGMRDRGRQPAPERGGSVSPSPAGAITAVGDRGGQAWRPNASGGTRCGAGPWPRLHRPAYALPARMVACRDSAPHLLVVAQHQHSVVMGNCGGGRSALPPEKAQRSLAGDLRRTGRGHSAWTPAARHRPGVGVLRRVVWTRRAPARWASVWRPLVPCDAAAPLRARRGLLRPRGDGQRRRHGAGPALRRRAGRGRLRPVHPPPSSRITWATEGRLRSALPAGEFADELHARCARSDATRRSRGVIEAAITSLPDTASPTRNTRALALLGGGEPAAGDLISGRLRAAGPAAGVTPRGVAAHGGAAARARPRGAAGVHRRPLRHPVLQLKEPAHLRHHGHVGPGLQPHGGGAARALRERGLPHPVEGGDGTARRIFRGQWRRITVRGAAGAEPRWLSLGQSIQPRRGGARHRTPPTPSLDLALADGLETLLDFR